jgi:hypothetical protein
MTTPSTVELDASQAATLLHRTLLSATDALQTGDTDASFDGYIRALGLALQLGPAPTEVTLHAVRAAADQLTQEQDSKGLCTLGPALVNLVDEVRATGALPQTPTMDSWATVATALGILVGQVGLALAIPTERRSKMLRDARTRAIHLDDATGCRLSLGDWLDGIPIA